MAAIAACGTVHSIKDAPPPPPMWGPIGPVSPSRAAAIELARQDFQYTIPLPGEQPAPSSAPRGPVSSEACAPAVDIERHVTAPGTITSVYDYLAANNDLPESGLNGFVMSDGRRVDGSIAYDLPVPAEPHQPIWNGFGYAIDAARRPGWVVVEIDAFVVLAGASCTTSSGAGA